MDLAKDRADVGLFTNRYDEMRDFYGGRLGLKFLETAGIGKVQQHRYDLGGSWLKNQHGVQSAPASFSRRLSEAGDSDRTGHATANADRSGRQYS